MKQWEAMNIGFHPVRSNSVGSGLFKLKCTTGLKYK